MENYDDCYLIKAQNGESGFCLVFLAPINDLDLGGDKRIVLVVPFEIGKITFLANFLLTVNNESNNGWKGNSEISIECVVG